MGRSVRNRPQERKARDQTDGKMPQEKREKKAFKGQENTKKMLVFADNYRGAPDPITNLIKKENGMREARIGMKENSITQAVVTEEQKRSKFQRRGETEKSSSAGKKVKDGRGREGLHVGKERTRM